MNYLFLFFMCLQPAISQDASEESVSEEQVEEQVEEVEEDVKVRNRS